MAFEVKLGDLGALVKNVVQIGQNPEFVYVRFRFTLYKVCIWKIIMKMRQMIF